MSNINMPIQDPGHQPAVADAESNLELKEIAGLSQGQIVRKRFLRHKGALISMIVLGGIILADVITGSFFVETVYSIPGLGRYFVQSISERDYPVILGTVLLLGAVVSVMNLVVDLLYPLLDPRIRA